jgi:DNA repair protein RadC
MEYLDFTNMDVKTLPKSERPRERLVQWGTGVLTDQELLAIILNSGIKGKNVNALAAELLDMLEERKNNPTLDELSSLEGMGLSKACTIMAMLELGRRTWDLAKVKIRTPQDIFDVVRHYANRRQERFISISLNGAHEVMAVRVVTVGLVNRTMVHPREVFAEPISDHCCAVCVCHNHPSGELEPSPEDDSVTLKLESAADILGIRFLDHLIFSEKSFYSYRKENKLRGTEKSEWFQV